jgi:hypothetical protein
VFGPGGKRVLAALRTVEVRGYVWRLAGNAAPNADGQVIVDLDGILVLAHSENAALPVPTQGIHDREDGFPPCQLAV